jgi:hypothetical protein
MLELRPTCEHCNKALPPAKKTTQCAAAPPSGPRETLLGSRACGAGGRVARTTLIRPLHGWTSGESRQRSGRRRPGRPRARACARAALGLREAALRWVVVARAGLAPPRWREWPLRDRGRANCARGRPARRRPSQAKVSLREEIACSCSLRGSAWDCRSAAPSLNRTAAACGLPTTPRATRAFASPYTLAEGRTDFAAGAGS